ADDVTSDRDVPPFTNSAMDGYAVRAVDTRSAAAAKPVLLEVLGEIRAGVAPPTSVRPSTALRIMTGAVMPEGADAVVRVEDTVERDGRGDLVARLQAAARTDLSVSTGGVSMGAYDLVRALLEEQGAVDFWQVALRPGKPLMVGTVEGRPLIGLPGNPVSSLVGVELFVRPAILKMQGRADLERQRLTATTDDALQNPPHLGQYFRGVARRDGDRIRVRLTGDQGSHVLRSMADANCLVVVPQGTSEVRAG